MKAQARTRLALSFVAVSLAACFGPDPNVTDSGMGLPVAELSFPAAAPPGSVQTAEIEISNPGPGDIGALLLTFARVGPGAPGGGLPAPIVDFLAGRSNDAVVSVEPAPDAVSDDGAVYRFGGLDVGEELTIRFQLRVPDTPGLAANSLTVSDAQDLERASGLRIETRVGAR